MNSTHSTPFVTSTLIMNKLVIVLAVVCAVCSATPQPGLIGAPLAYTAPVAAPLAYPGPALAAYAAPIASSHYAVNQVHSVAAAPLAVAPARLAYPAPVGVAHPFAAPYLLG